MKRLISIVGITIFMLYNLPSGNAEKEKTQFTIVQLTDIHYSSTPPKEDGISWKHRVRLLGYKLHKVNLSQGRQILENTVEYINKTIKPDMLIVTGDIVNSGNDKEGMNQAKDILDKLNCPYYPVIGDHDLNDGEDKRKNYKEVFGDMNYSLDYKGWHIIMLGIYPNDRDLEWLKEDLAKNTDKPTMLFMHRMLKASWLMKKLSKRYYCPEIISPRAKEIIGILKGHNKVIATFSGHSHTNYSRKKGRILYVSTASLAEVPYQFRIVKVYKEKVTTSVGTAHPLRKR